MSSSRYDAVLFDLDRTLVEHDQSPGDVFEAACSKLGIEPFCEPSVLELAARAVGEQSTELDAAEFERRQFETAAAAAGVDVDGAAMASAYADALDNAAVSLRPGARRALELGSAYDRAVVTNGPERTHATKLRAVGLHDRFDEVVYGSDVPRVKPAPVPFERALNRLDASPERTLKVGDSLEKDVAGANAVGMDVAWIPYGNRRRASSDPEPTYALSSLSELAGIL